MTDTELSTSTRSVLIDAKRRIETCGWSQQHEFWPPAGLSARDSIDDYSWRLTCPATLYGSLKRLNDKGLEVVQNIADSPLLTSTGDAAVDVSLLVGQLIPHMFPSRCGDDPPWDAIHTLNYHPDTTAQDIVDVLDAALRWLDDGQPVEVHDSEDARWHHMVRDKKDQVEFRRELSSTQR